jgi:arylsulfatase A-like enzyme
MSDNGAPLREGAYVGSLNYPLVGEKGMQTDGGQRIPYVGAWPGVIPPNQVFTKPVSTLDAAATGLAAAGAPFDDRIEGVDLLPWLTGKETGPVHDELCWRWRSQSAILSGDGKWKFIRLGERQRFLFDMTEIGKQTAADNLIEQHPEIAVQLEARLKAVAETWKVKGLSGDPPARPDQAFYDQHVHKNRPPLPLDAGMSGAFIPMRDDSERPPGGARNDPRIHGQTNQHQPSEVQ